ncbi:MAG: YihY/virulence factor BrkB family protein [Clostridia bacterium]|nr:YihY/virulence factor BrkB family protein [Clostridia bacterium]
MKKILENKWVKRFLAVCRYIGERNIPVYASNASFFIVLSVFPTLVLLLGLLRYTGLEVENLTELLHGIIPTALMPAAQKLIMNTYNSSTGTILSISALTALWSASRGVYGLVTGLNSIYGTSENRGYFYTRTVSVLYTFGFLIVLLLTLVLHVFGTTLVELLPLESSPLFRLLESVVDLRFFVLLGVQTALFTAMFMVLPNKRNKLGDSFPGAVLASIGWLVFSDLYSIYVENFAGLSNIYGSVYAVALSMLWLYCCVSILFYGGALNHWLTDHKEK